MPEVPENKRIPDKNGDARKGTGDTQAPMGLQAWQNDKTGDGHSIEECRRNL